MVRIVLGFLLGALAVGLRRSPGETLFELPAASAALALWSRAAALFLGGLAVLLARRSLDGRPNEGLLLGAALGALAEGLRTDLRVVGPSAMLALAPVALAALLVRELRRPPTPTPPVSRPGFVPALFVAGLGLALSIDPIAREALRLGGGTGMEDAFVTALFLGLAAFGGLAFGAPLRSATDTDRAGSRVALTAAVAVVPLITISWWALAGQAISPIPRKLFFDRFGLDASLEGQLHVTGLVALLGLLLPAFATGLAVSCARRRAELAALCFGAAVGAIAQATRPELESWFVGPLALVVAGILGGIEPRSPLRDRGRLPGVFVLALAAGCLFPLSQMSPPPVLFWERFPAPPTHATVAREGQLLVKLGAARGAEVLLDRVEVAPGRGRAAADAEQLRIAMALVPAQVRAGGVRVLLVGQLTPGRLLVLAEGGASVIDRTAAWWSSMATLEQALFGENEALLHANGQVRSLDDARAALSAGDYDLVLVPSVVGGPPPRIPRLEGPEGTLIVAWVDAALDLAQRRMDGPVLIATDGLDHLALGFVSGVELTAEPRPGQPAVMLPGEPIPPPKFSTFAFERPQRRARRARAALARRLAAANADNGWAELTAGLAAHYAVQEDSSPLATRAQRTELSRDALTFLLAAAVRAEPDRLTRGVLDGLAHILVGKRDVAAIWEWIEPVAGVWNDWPEGQIALAHGDLESLDFDGAQARLEAIEPGPDQLLLAAKHLAAVQALARALEADGQVERAGALLAAPQDG